MDMNSTMITWEQDEDGVVVLTMDDPQASVNTMTDAWRQSMEQAVDRLEAERENVTGVVLTSAKSTFFAGGNLDMIAAYGPDDAEAVFALAEGIKAALRRLETLGLPVVAALNGTALGGGLEIALACHRRIAVDDASARFGLPEVGLGLLPGGGGITRLVRMLGLQKALNRWLLDGVQRSPSEAQAEGVIDELVADREMLLPAARAWILQERDEEERLQAVTQPWDQPGYRMPGGAPGDPEQAAFLSAYASTLQAKLKGAEILAPRAILHAAVEGAQVDFATACRIESRHFVRLVVGWQSSAMIQAFHTDMQSVRSGASLGRAGRKPDKVSSVAVLGAGMMGAGIAYALAVTGVDVVLKDVDAAAAERGLGHVSRLLEKEVSRGRRDEAEAKEVLGRIRATGDMQDIADVDAVIEAVFEDFELKQSVFAEVEQVVRPGTLLCSNTSTLPITELQADRREPDAFVGLHFFSPVDRMRLVEIIRGEQTSQETLNRAYGLVQQIRKLPILVNDGRGFFTSRVYVTLVLEGAALVEEGVPAQQVEGAARRAGFPAPPLAMLDEVSLTLLQHGRREEEKAAEASGGTRPLLPGEKVLDRMVDEFHRPGRAQGAGFYDYPEGEPKRLWPGLAEHFGASTQIPDEDVQDRYLFRMAVETARCFEDGILTDTASANIGGIFGISFPAHTGGPATFATHRPDGLEGFVRRADELADRYGERFRPSAWLRDRAASGAGLV